MMNDILLRIPTKGEESRRRRGEKKGRGRRKEKSRKGGGGEKRQKEKAKTRKKFSSVKRLGKDFVVKVFSKICNTQDSNTAEVQYILLQVYPRFQ